MQLFYTYEVKDGLAFLKEEEARHCVQVLRKNVGDRLYLIDGNGGLYEAELIEAHKKNCVLSILKEQLAYNKRSFYLHLAIAPTKNISRFEWFLEKATEIGIDEITPILCKHSERKVIKMGRLEKILLSATKQSLKAYLPKLNELTKFATFLKKMEEENFDSRYIAYCRDENIHLKENYKSGNNVLLLIGPEGDFSEQEVELAKTAGYQGTSLGKSRLRTETAGIVACHALNFLNE